MIETHAAMSLGHPTVVLHMTVDMTPGMKLLRIFICRAARPHIA